MKTKVQTNKQTNKHATLPIYQNKNKKLIKYTDTQSYPFTNLQPMTRRNSNGGKMACPAKLTLNWHERIVISN